MKSYERQEHRAILYCFAAIFRKPVHRNLWNGHNAGNFSSYHQ